MTRIGKNIERLRREKRWSQSDLARESGVSQPTISQLERGANKQPTAKTAKKLAAALGVSDSEIFAKPAPPPEPAPPPPEPEPQPDPRYMPEYPEGGGIDVCLCEVCGKVVIPGSPFCRFHQGWEKMADVPELVRKLFRDKDPTSINTIRKMLLQSGEIRREVILGILTEVFLEAAQKLVERLSKGDLSGVQINAVRQLAAQLIEAGAQPGAGGPPIILSRERNPIPDRDPAVFGIDPEDWKS